MALISFLFVAFSASVVCRRYVGAVPTVAHVVTPTATGGLVAPRTGVVLLELTRPRDARHDEERSCKKVSTLY